MTGPDVVGVDDPAMDRSSLRDAIEAGRARLDAALARYDDAAMLERVDDASSVARIPKSGH